ncbi:hypothetical protein PIROE2DRAFT_12204 [Piromyces sp. E2]|nr:hypothetical protein PIROE2DRAFT_12204 [Piromyces sp. E2]|eukprot:OUM61707.1 hypothetical protein PIROE2DRAFT_12204 [Piromyces sp. E2]
MNVNIFYLLVLITLFNLCASKKSGLYPNQNQVDSGSDEEYNNDDYNNSYEEYVEQVNEKKSALYGNQQEQQQNQEEQNINNENNDENQDSTVNTSEQINSRHQFKYSFKRPYYYYNDTNIIPHWKYKGDVIPANDMIRLVPSVPNKRGSIWSDLQNQYNEWQIVLSFRIFGRSITGSEGLALFYTDKQLSVDSFFGGEHRFKGFAIIFDSSNIDPNSRIPTINVLYNDGNTIIQSQKEYTNIRKSLCVADFRNSPLPVYVRITYVNKNLKIEVDLSHEGNEYYECSNEKIDLPDNYYFGLGAKTGDGVPDDHDIYSFDFYQLNPPPKENYKYRPNEEEIIEREGEYQIDDETLGHIKRVNEQLVKEKSKDDPKEKVVDAQTVQLTQFRILETVNRILAHVQTQNYNPDNQSQNEFIEDLSNKSEQLISDVSEVYDSLEKIKHTVDAINDSVERNSQKSDYKINSVETKLNQKLSSEFNKVLNELRHVKEENRRLKEATQNLTKETQSKPNIWLVSHQNHALN